MIDYSLRVMYQLAMGSIKQLKFNEVSKYVETDFRCWPIDIDLFFHMNNASYIRVAELSRWRMFPRTGMYNSLKSKGILFLVVDQRVIYQKPIQPFQKYVVRTDIQYSSTDDKWLYYKHTFLQHPTQIKPGQLPVQYAVVELKAVAKEASGKTIKASMMANLSELNQKLMKRVDGPWTSELQ